MVFIVVGQWREANLNDPILLAFPVNIKLTPKSLQIYLASIVLFFTTI